MPQVRHVLPQTYIKKTSVYTPQTPYTFVERSTSSCGGYFFDTRTKAFGLSPPSTLPWPLTTIDITLAGEPSKSVGPSCTLFCHQLNHFPSFKWEPHHYRAINHSHHVCMKDC